jgi:hypothetical protein
MTTQCELRLYTSTHWVSLYIHYRAQVYTSGCIKVASMRNRPATALAVSRRYPTAAARVRDWVRPCGICGQSGTGAFFRVSGILSSGMWKQCGSCKNRRLVRTCHIHHQCDKKRWDGINVSSNSELLLTFIPSHRFVQPWWWRRYVPPKRRFL